MLFFVPLSIEGNKIATSCHKLWCTASPSTGEKTLVEADGVFNHYDLCTAPFYLVTLIVSFLKFGQSCFLHALSSAEAHRQNLIYPTQWSTCTIFPLYYNAHSEQDGRIRPDTTNTITTNTEGKK